MIVTEEYTVRPDGVRLIKTYSDSGLIIKKVGTDEEYTEAVDPEDSGRVYVETDKPIPEETVESPADMSEFIDVD